VQKLILIAIAGSIGTLARYGLAGFVQRFTYEGFPWGTFAVNATGCFLAGCLWTLAEDRLVLTGEQRAMVFIGFMGSFTTFSTYMLETSNLVRDGEWGFAILNMVLQNGAGFAALFAGIFIGRVLVS
jgi:fluoride exporter